MQLPPGAEGEAQRQEDAVRVPPKLPPAPLRLAPLHRRPAAGTAHATVAR